jgi:1-acyl-sn-glycerol-3-phosphate acyltransferase
MLDLARMRRIKLSPRPRVQRLLGWAVLMPNYNLPPRVRIDCEGAEHLPRESVIFAMNHTDRYNYWPFQYWLWRNVGRYTATWVKGKYYENAALGRFMELTNNIPTPSRGYVLTKDFVHTVGRRPSEDEYQALRRLAHGEVDAAAALPAAVATEPRNILGRDYNPRGESYGECIDALMRALMARFVEINAECFDRGLDLLVFPEGTRSLKLSRGHIGVAQAALRFRKTIVPVGCSGSDKVYPGSSPIARGGEIMYRIGEPITFADAAAYHLPEGVDPFGAEDDPAHRDKLQGLVDVVMDRINGLVDPAYRFADDRASRGEKGSRRFV